MGREGYYLGLVLVAIGFGGLGLSVNCMYSLLRGDEVYDQSSARAMATSQLIGIVIGMAIAVGSGIALIKFMGLE